MELNIKELDEKLKSNVSKFEENLKVIDLMRNENIRYKKNLEESYKNFTFLNEECVRIITEGDRKFNELTEKMRTEIEKNLEEITLQQTDFELEFQKTYKEFSDAASGEFKEFTDNIDERFNVYMKKVVKRLKLMESKLEEEIKSFNDNMDILKLANKEEFEQFNMNIEAINKYINEHKKEYRDNIHRLTVTQEAAKKEIDKNHEQINLNIEAVNKYIKELKQEYEDNIHKITLIQTSVDKEICEIHEQLKNIINTNSEHESTIKSLQEKLNKNFKINLIASGFLTLAAILIMYLIK